MRNERKVWELMRDVSSSIYPLAQSIMQAQFEKYFSEQRFYPPTFIAYQIAPKNISVELLDKRNPYVNPTWQEKRLADTAKVGYLDLDGMGGYVISEKGANAINAVHGAFYNHINKVNRFPTNKLEELAALLDKLVGACAKTDIPNDTLCLDISHNGHPKVESGSLAQIDQYLDDMNAFRDDAHLAAWTPTEVSGHVWEVLSFVWNGEADTVEKLVERLPYRNYTAEDYANTLEGLQQRGWIEPGGEDYKVTAEGRKIRDDAESATDTNFFEPWKIFLMMR